MEPINQSGISSITSRNEGMNDQQNQNVVIDLSVTPSPDEETIQRPDNVLGKNGQSSITKMIEQFSTTQYVNILEQLVDIDRLKTLTSILSVLQNMIDIIICPISHSVMIHHVRMKDGFYIMVLTSTNR